MAEMAAGLAPFLAPAPAEAERPPFYTVARLAELTGLTRKTIRNAIARGELAAVKHNGQWLIAADAAEIYGTPPAPIARRRPAVRRSVETGVRLALSEAMGCAKVRPR